MNETYQTINELQLNQMTYFYYGLLVGTIVIGALDILATYLFNKYIR